MAAPTSLPEQVLAWSNGLMASRSLGQLAEMLARPPALKDESLTGVLLLFDPRHELRLLAAAEDKRAEAWPGLKFCDSLAGVAPGYGTMQAPWSGPFHAADHGLLIAADAGCRYLTLLPLPRSGGVTGVYNVGSRKGPVAVAALEPAWLEHVAAQVQASAERLLHRARQLGAGVVDPLTGWNGRHYFVARMREQVAASARHQEPASCLVIDVDRLAALNDKHGIAAGDAALLEIGNLVEAQVRASDSFARLGEDEFAALLPATRPEFAVQLAGRILAAVRTAPAESTREGRGLCTVSIGIAGLDPADPQVADERKAITDEWLARAYSALHQAKRAGGDRHATC